MLKFWCITGCVCVCGEGGGWGGVFAAAPRGKDEGLAKLVANVYMLNEEFDL